MTMQKWEYRHIVAKDKLVIMDNGSRKQEHPMIEYMNLLGKDEWELVCSEPIHPGNAFSDLSFYFKRPLQGRDNE